MSALLDEIREKYGQNASYHAFFNDIAGLPPSLRLASVEVNVIYDSTQAARKRFERRTKPGFLKWLARYHGGRLLEMGISNFEIDRMLDQGFLPKNRAGQKLDCTIDHILSLQFGGTNDFKNLCLLSGFYNKMKSKLESIQLTGGERNTFITIVPAATDGVDERIPYMQNGFEPRN